MVVLPGYELKISDHFTMNSKKSSYFCDFRDGWKHRILLRGINTNDGSLNIPFTSMEKELVPRKIAEVLGNIAISSGSLGMDRGMKTTRNSLNG